MHVLIVNDWLDHDYIARYTLGWDAAARARAAMDAGARRSGLRRAGGADRRPGARLRHAPRPAAIRLNYGMQRVRGGGNAARAIACLPALVGAWRDRAGGMLLSAARACSRWTGRRCSGPTCWRAGAPRTINMTHDRRRRCATASPNSAEIEALIVYNTNPVAVAPESGKVVAGFAREDLFTVVLEQFQTDTADYADFCCRRPRSSSTGTSTPATATPT